MTAPLVFRPAVIEKAAGRPRRAVSPQVIRDARRALADSDAVLKAGRPPARSWADLEAEMARLSRVAQAEQERTQAGALGALETLAKAAVRDGTAATLEQAMADAAMTRPDLVTRYRRGLR